MIVVPLVLLVGGIVAACYGAAKEEVREENRERALKLEDQEEERAYKEAQESAKLAAQRAYDEVKAEAERAYKEAREDAKEARGDAKEARKQAHQEGHGEAEYMTPFYLQWVDRPVVWDLKAVPNPTPMVLLDVSPDGLVFQGVPGVVPFHHVEGVKEFDEEDEDENEDENED